MRKTPTSVTSHYGDRSGPSANPPCEWKTRGAELPNILKNIPLRVTIITNSPVEAEEHKDSAAVICDKE